MSKRMALGRDGLRCLRRAVPRWCDLPVSGRRSHHRDFSTSRGWDSKCKRRAPHAWPVSVCPFGDGERQLGIYMVNTRKKKISTNEGPSLGEEFLSRRSQRHVHVLPASHSLRLLGADADRSCHCVQSLLPSNSNFWSAVTERQERFSRVSGCSCLRTDTRQAGSDACLLRRKVRAGPPRCYRGR